MSDGHGGTDTATVSLTVNPDNDDPVAIDDSDSTAEDVALVIDGNGSVGQRQRYRSGYADHRQLHPAEPRQRGGQRRRDLHLHAGANYNGADSFTYTVSDGDGGTDTATVSLTVNPANDEPVALDDSDSTAEDMALVIDGPTC